MSFGFPDGQRITQWLGQVLAQATGLAIGAGVHTDGPYALASWASVVVAVKPTGGRVTVNVKQGVSGGPASLVNQAPVDVPAGSTAFLTVVLLGPAVTLELTGYVGGTTVDYALFPSNVTTNSAVISSAPNVLDTARLSLSAPPQAVANGALANISLLQAFDWATNLAVWRARSAAGPNMEVGQGGIYRCSAFVEFAAGAGVQRFVALYLNTVLTNIRARLPPAGGVPTDITISGNLNLAAGDLVNINVLQDSGGVLNVADAWLAMDKLT